MTKPKKEHNKKALKPAIKNKVNIESKKGTAINGRQEKVKRPVKAAGGLGLGKAGAKRLGQMLMRAIQEKDKVKGNETKPLPKTPVRLLKHKAKELDAIARARLIEDRKMANPGVPQLIMRVISQCKHRGGITMVELKQALAAGGYDVTKNNARVNLAVKGLVRKETLLQTTGTGASGSFKINKKKLTDEKKMRTRAMRSREAKKARKERAAGKTSKTLKPTGIPPKPAGKAPKPAGNAPKPAGNAPKPAGKAPKPVVKTPKPGSKNTKPAVEAQKLVRKAAEPEGKTPKVIEKEVKVVAKAPAPAVKNPKPTGKARIVPKQKSSTPVASKAKPRLRGAVVRTSRRKR